jgi:hypothetical protein
MVAMGPPRHIPRHFSSSEARGTLFLALANLLLWVSGLGDGVRGHYCGAVQARTYDSYGRIPLLVNYVEASIYVMVERILYHDLAL